MLLSLQHVPYEVLQKITSHVDHQTRLACLLICKAFYFPALESLYHHVVLNDLVSFRYFLSSISHHRHQPNLYVKHLDLQTGYFLADKERDMTFTEFELLARYCVNLTQLAFYQQEYWQFLKEIDLTVFWHKLTRIPTMNSISLPMYERLSERLVMLDIWGPFRSYQFLFDLLPRMTHLQTIRMDDRQLVLSTAFIQQISTAYPKLQRLDLKTKISSNSGLLPPTVLEGQATTTTTINTLACTIDSYDSAWFSLLKTAFQNINSLTAQFRNNKDPDHLLKMIAPMMETVYATNIQTVSSEFAHVKDLTLFIENFIVETVYTYDVLFDHQQTPSQFALIFNYADTKSSMNGLVSKQQRDKIPQHQFTVHCVVAEVEDHNAVKYIKRILQSPICNQLTQLTLTRTVRLSIRDLEASCYPVHLDAILDYFPNLEYLKINLVKRSFYLAGKYRKIEDPRYNQDFTLVTLLDSSKSKIYPQHPSLRKLVIESCKIDRSVYFYMFSKCPHFTTLVIRDCNLKDDETVLALEYLCLEHNVELLFFE